MTVDRTINLIIKAFDHSEVEYTHSDSPTQSTYLFKDKELSLDKVNNSLYYRHRVGDVAFIKVVLYPSNFKRDEELLNYLISIIYLD